MRCSALENRCKAHPRLPGWRQQGLEQWGGWRWAFALEDGDGRSRGRMEVRVRAREHAVAVRARGIVTFSRTHDVEQDT